MPENAAMKHWWAFILMGPCVLFAQQGPVAPAAGRPVMISLPREINPDTVVIEYGFYGTGLSMGRLPTRAGVHDYPVGPPAPEIGAPTSLKLLIYIPGYRMVTTEFLGKELQTGTVFTPPLVPLSTTIVRGQLIDSADEPLGNESLKVEYMLMEEMGYYGYADGGVGSFHVADIVTNDNGEFSFSVPSLLDDPFFAGFIGQGQFAPRGSFQIKSAGNRGFVDSTLAPNSFPAQKSYEPLAIRKEQKGTLTGKLGRQFLRQNNLSEDLRVYVRPRDTIVTGIQLRAKSERNSFNATVFPDGTFELQVPAGKYDIEIWVEAEARRITLEDDIVVEEGRQRVFERP
jgi:hypothetical protein